MGNETHVAIPARVEIPRAVVFSRRIGEGDRNDRRGQRIWALRQIMQHRKMRGVELEHLRPVARGSLREDDEVLPLTQFLRQSRIDLGDRLSIRALDENSPLKPLSIYGRTKVEAEAAIMQRGEAIAFRLATVFGMAPRMRIDLLVNDFTYRAVRDRAVVIFEGHFKRNFIHIRDVANGFLFGMKNFDRMKNEVYNMGLSEANLSKLELAAAIKKEVPGFTYLEAPIGDDPDKRDYIVSNAKLEATGWAPGHGLGAGIRELVKGYRTLRNEIWSNV